MNEYTQEKIAEIVLRTVLVLALIGVVVAMFTMPSWVPKKYASNCEEQAWKEGYEAGKEVIRNEAEAVGVGWWRDSGNGNTWFSWAGPHDPQPYFIQWNKDACDSQLDCSGPYKDLVPRRQNEPPPPPPFDPVVGGVVTKDGKKIGSIATRIYHGRKEFLAVTAFQFPDGRCRAATFEREEDAAWWLARRYTWSKGQK